VLVKQTHSRWKAAPSSKAENHNQKEEKYRIRLASRGVNLRGCYKYPRHKWLI